MKKLLSLTLSLIVAISCCSLFGCFGDSTFNGNYKEATADEITALKTELKESDKSISYDAEEIAKGKGYELTIKMDMEMEMDFGDLGGQIYAKYNYDSSLKVANKEGKIISLADVKADVEASGAGENMDALAQGSIYFDGEVAYADMKIEGTDGNQTINKDYKYKQEVDFDQIESLTGLSGGDALGLNFVEFDLEDAIVDFEKMGKIEIDFSDDTARKIKLTVDGDKLKEELSSTPMLGEIENYDFKDFEVIFVYNNETKELIGYKTVIDFSFMGISYDAKIEIKPFDGNIKAPAGLDKYENGDITGGL